MTDKPASGRDDNGRPVVARPEPLVISRSFAAPRALVFQAWSTAEHMKRWFSPAGLTVAEAEVDFRPGGACAICMRAPDGQDFWSRGEYVEIIPPERLVMRGYVGEPSAPGFTATSTVLFEVEGDGTRLTVHQAYEIHDLAFMTAITGAPEGWRTTLDKLEAEVARIQAGDARRVVHDSFSLQRVYDASPAMVFRALTDKAAKGRWFVGGAGFEVLEREMDVRPGGRERVKGRMASGVVSTFDATYYDVIADRRLVYSYEMHQDARKISVSLATMELQPEGGGTRLTVTEQGAFLDGYEDAGAREHGTGMLLDQLDAALAAPHAPKK